MSVSLVSAAMYEINFFSLVPYGFSMKCRAYWSDENGYRP